MRRDARQIRLAVVADVLHPFPLVDRVLNVHRQAVLGAEPRDPLIQLARLPLEAVAADDQHPGVGGRVLRLIGEEHRSGGVEVGEGFQDDLLDPDAVLPGHRAGDLGVERGFFPQFPKVLPEVLAAGGLVGGQVAVGD